MKKTIYSIFILFIFFFLTNAVKAEVFDCGETDFRFDDNAITHIQQNDYAPVQCLGEKITNDCQDAKLVVRTLTKGNVVYNVSKMSDGVCAVKLEIGTADGIAVVDNKKFANTYLSCPVNVNHLQQLATMNNIATGTKMAQSYAVYTYIESGIDDFGMDNSSCFGSYIDKAREAGFYKTATGTDARPVFAELFSGDFLASIKSKFNLNNGQAIGCLDEYANSDDCSHVFDDKTVVAHEMLKIKASKVNYDGATRLSFDNKKAEDQAKLVFANLSNATYPAMYLKETGDKIQNKKWDELAQFWYADKKIILARSSSMIVEVVFAESLNGSDVSAVMDKMYNVIKGTENGGSVNFAGNGVSIVINTDILKPSSALTTIAQSTPAVLTDTKPTPKTETKTEVETSAPISVERQLSSYKIIDNALYERLKGKIILKVQGKGEAYYVSPSDKMAYYLGRPTDAFRVMRERGVGINNVDIAKILPGAMQVIATDVDGDGLSDLYEGTIGTDKGAKDTDSDGYSDFDEINNGYDPLVKIKKLNFDKVFSNRQKGKILLQVQSKGEAWYVDTKNTKRYFMGRPADAFQVMRRLGVGVTDADFVKLLGNTVTSSSGNTVSSSSASTKDKVVMAIRANNKTEVQKYFSENSQNYLNYIMTSLAQDKKNKWADLIAEADFVSESAGVATYRTKIAYAGYSNNVDYVLKKIGDKWIFENL